MTEGLGRIPHPLSAFLAGATPEASRCFTRERTPCGLGRKPFDRLGVLMSLDAARRCAPTDGGEGNPAACPGRSAPFRIETMTVDETRETGGMQIPLYPRPGQRIRAAERTVASIGQHSPCSPLPTASRF